MFSQWPTKRSSNLENTQKSVVGFDNLRNRSGELAFPPSLLLLLPLSLFPLLSPDSMAHRRPKLLLSLPEIAGSNPTRVENLNADLILQLMLNLSSLSPLSLSIFVWEIIIKPNYLHMFCTFQYSNIFLIVYCRILSVRDLLFSHFFLNVEFQKIVG